MAFLIVIDGPNFINELHRHGKDKDYIMKKLNFPVLHHLIQTKLSQHGLYSHPFLRTEFICSNKPKIGEFKGTERTNLLARLRRQTGVSVRVVKLSSKGEQEKGVDITVFATMLERGGPVTHAVLMGADRDYIPAMNALTKRNIHTILVTFPDIKYFEEMINESYLYLDLGKLLNDMDKAVERGGIRKLAEQQKKVAE